MGVFESLTNSAINAIDRLTLRYSNFIKSKITDYCDFDTPIDDHTLVTHNRALLSFIDIHGVLSRRGDEEFIEAIKCIEILFTNLLETGDHSIQWVFSRMPSQTEVLLDSYFEPLKKAGVSQSFNEAVLKQIFSERHSVLSQYVSHEGCILVLKTHPEALGSIERNAQVKERQNNDERKAFKKNKLPLDFGEFAQTPLVSVSRLNLIHQAALQTLVNELSSSGMGLSSRLLDCHQALSKIRLSQHFDETSPSWRPVLPGDPIPYRDRAVMNGDKDNAFYPIIGSQIFKRQAKIEGDIVQIGSHYWSTISINLSPQEPKSFEVLFQKIPKEIDWRFSLSFLGGDKKFAQKVKTRRAMAKVFKVTNSKQNEPIINHCEMLLSIREQGEALVGLRGNLSIRASSLKAATNDIHLCARLVQSWGNCDTGFERGDPVDALVSTLPGLDSLDTGSTLIQPLRESALLCPISRPVSPWQAFGTNLYRTPDGRIFPVQMCSSEQVAWIDIYFAKPGSGKSVLLNSQNINLCLTPGLKQLPKICILDIGPSSQGLIQLLHELLPPHRRGEAVHKTLKQDKSCSINPFDTPLGMRFLHSAKMDFLKSFLLLLFTEDGEKKIKPGIGELVSMLLIETYKTFSDDYSPKEYERHVEPSIDQIIDENPSWFYDEQTGGDHKKPSRKCKKMTWWQITDVLAGHESWLDASIAQRQAVPLLVDLTGILHSNQAIKDIFAKTGQDEQTVIHLIKMIRSAINEHKILSYPTQFNLGQARVVALDLADVTGRGSQYTLKKSGLMYMLGREVLFGNLYFGEDDIKSLNEVYRHYHHRRINQDLGDIKRVCCDEYHRTADLEAVRLQMEQDMREGRKYKVAFSLASQRHEDFTKSMVGLATNIYICNGAQGNDLKEIVRVFGLSASEKNALKYDVHGAGKGGASFLFKSETKSGWITQVLVNSLGLLELWALASTAEDALIRKKCLEYVPYFKALSLLSKAFPSGSAKDSILERVKETGFTTERVIDDLIQNLLPEGEKNNTQLFIKEN
jgi:intracellular multiplication protein IcmB